MKVLIACEYTGVVREAFRKRGHDAWSCDIRPSLLPGPHLQTDVLGVLDGDWDLLIAHPPCTDLAVSGARWFPDKVVEQEEALDFVRLLLNCGIPRRAIENPVSIISSRIRKPDQIVQPWMFGDPYTKRTCLWLHGLPKLEPTKIVDGGEIVIHGGKKIPKWYSNNKKDRDRTFPGVADAMAQQWG